MTDYDGYQLHWWSSGDLSSKKTISFQDNSAKSLFITSNDNMYLGSDASDKGPQLCNSSSNICHPHPKRPGGNCNRVFVDINDYLYCSMEDSHEVVKISVRNSSSDWTRTAGGNGEGEQPNQLKKPHGIFVDAGLNLFVADSGNNRIQMFQNDMNNGTTVVGGTENKIVQLVQPTLIAFDSDSRMFIVQKGNCCIVRVDSEGFQCILQKSDSSRQPSITFADPTGFAFDSHGNMFLINQEKIHQFQLASNSCSKCNVDLIPTRSQVGADFEKQISTHLISDPFSMKERL